MRAGELAIDEIGVFPRRGYTLLRLTTRSGIQGLGECGEVSAADVQFVAERVRGRPATAYELAGELLAARPGLRSAVDMALLDIVGKAVKAPVYQVLGGPTRFKVRVVARLEGGTDDALAAALARAEAAGVRCHSVPLPGARGKSQAFADAVLSRLERLRKAGGAQTNFVLDGAGELAPGLAGSLCAALERFHLLWFDDPCPAANLRAVSRLASESVTPVGFGRRIADAGTFQDLLREGAIDVLRTDLRVHGISQARRLAALAETYYVAAAPYSNGGPVGAAAALHLAASLPNSFAIEIPLPPAGTVADGYLALPASPGLGIQEMPA